MESRQPTETRLSIPTQDDRLMRPTSTAILRQLYWNMRKRPTSWRYAANAIAGATSHAARLTLSKASTRGRPLLAISLVEHMGDIAAAEPFAQAARQRFPKARIVWITRETYRSLPDAYPEVDETLVVQCMSEWLLLWSFGVFDEVWDLHLTDRQCPCCNVGFQKPGKPGKITYETYYDFGNLTTVQAMAAGIEAVRQGPSITTTQEVRRAVDALDLPMEFVVIHAKSNDLTRDWDADKWVRLVDHLCDTYPGNVVEIGSTAQVIKQDAPGRINLCGRVSMLESAEVIRRACLFVGIDSGPAHLANAVSTPGVILIGDYNNFRGQMPYSGFYATAAGATILRADGPAAMLDETLVVQAIKTRLVSESAHEQGSPAQTQTSQLPTS